MTEHDLTAAQLAIESAAAQLLHDLADQLDGTAVEQLLAIPPVVAIDLDGQDPDTIQLAIDALSGNLAANLTPGDPR